MWKRFYTVREAENPIADLTAKTAIHAPFGYTIVGGDNASSAVSFYVTGIGWINPSRGRRSPRRRGARPIRARRR